MNSWKKQIDSTIIHGKNANQIHSEILLLTTRVVTAKKTYIVSVGYHRRK
jgi:hypothetical protein